MPVPPYTPQTKGELLEVHASLFLGAPDSFFKLPNVLPEEQQTLESTVAELHRGVDHVFRKDRHAQVRAKLHDLVEHEDNGVRIPDRAVMEHFVLPNSDFVVKGRMEYRMGAATEGTYGYEPLEAIHDHTSFPEYTELYFTNYGAVVFLGEKDEVIAVLNHRTLLDIVEAA